MQCSSIRYLNKCFYVAYSEERWHVAAEYCEKINHTLARVRSKDEATFLASYLYDDPEHMLYWIDLNDEETEGLWTYRDGSIGYTDWWATGDPNGNRAENCGTLVNKLCNIYQLSN